MSDSDTQAGLNLWADGHLRCMTNPAVPVDATLAPTSLSVPPAMPSIAASALLESQLLVARTRRVLAAWLARG